MNLAELDAVINLVDRTTARLVGSIVQLVRPHLVKTDFINLKTGARAMLWLPARPILIIVDHQAIPIAGIGDGWYINDSDKRAAPHILRTQRLVPQGSESPLPNSGETNTKGNTQENMNGHREPNSKKMGQAITASGGKLVRKTKHGTIYCLPDGASVMVGGRLDCPRGYREVRSKLRKHGIAC